MVLSLGVIALMIIFFVTMALTHRIDTPLFPAGLTAFLVLYWLISDVFAVKWMDLFADKTPEQKKAYYICAAMDAAGFVGLTLFLINMESMTGVIIYVACTVMKRRFRDEFHGITKDGEEAAEIVDIEETSVEITDVEETAAENENE